MNNINTTFLYQMLKLRTIALNSEYSFLYPGFIDSVFNDNLKRKSVIRRLYNEVREGSIGIKVDNMESASNIYWLEKYADEDREKYYYQICIDIAKQFFKIRSGQIYIDGNIKKFEDKYDYNYDNFKNSLNVGRKTNNKFQWYIIKQLMDIDTLIGAYLVENNLTSISDMKLWDTLLYTTDTLLENVLKKGVAELHMHLGASKSFTSLWTSLMNSNKHNQTNIRVMNLLKSNYNYGKVDFYKNIYLFRLLRIVLSLYIGQGSNESQCTFEEFIDYIDENNKINNIVTKILKHMEEEKYTIDNDKSIKVEDIQSIIIGLSIRFDLTLSGIDKSGIDFNDTEKIDLLKKSSYVSHDKVNNYCKVIYDRMKNSLVGDDILVKIFKNYYIEDDKNIYSPFVIYPEQVFIFESMKYIKKDLSNKKASCFEKLFWHYIKFKNLVYRQIVQEVTYGNGLDIFQEYYKKQSAISINKLVYEAFYSQTKNQNIRKFEIRIGIGNDKGKVVELLSEIFNQYLAIIISNEYLNKDYSEIPLLGIIFHFIKKPDSQKEKCIYKEERGNLRNELKDEYLHQAKIINEIRQDIDKIDNYIVGVDAASKENNTEPYVFKKAFNYLRDTDSFKSGNGKYIKELGFTYHVGEEFRDLLSGLRHIDETIELFNYKSGDRLGHAIALGIDVDKWAEYNQLVFINAGEYLDNLLWQWNLYIEEKIGQKSISELEQRIYDAVEYIFGFTEHLSIRELYKAYYMKINCEECVTDVATDLSIDGVCALQQFTKKKYSIKNKIPRSNNEDNNVVWTTQMIYKAEKCKYFTRELDKNVTINIDNEIIEIYKEIQKIMIRKIGERQIIVETNPTSNLTIGEFKCFKDYYITNLSSPAKEKVIVTINSDDPTVFSTRINNEYALIYDILMKSGKYTGKEIIDWLNKIRINGLEYSFIEDRKLQIQELKNEIIHIIEQLKIYF